MAGRAGGAVRHVGGRRTDADCLLQCVFEVMHDLEAQLEALVIHRQLSIQPPYLQRGR